MKIIKQSAELEAVCPNTWQFIEKCGRVCYKSEDLITNNSAEKFVQKIIISGHESVLEHSVVILRLSIFRYIWWKLFYPTKYFNMTCVSWRPIVSGSFRSFRDLYRAKIGNTWIEKLMNGLALEYGDAIRYGFPCLVGKDRLKLDFIHYLELLTEKEKMAHWVVTFRFITDRGVTHEIVRHRPPAYSQESTRYCNYRKGKYGGEVTFILPVWHYEDCNSDKYMRWFKHCKFTEDTYLEMIENGDKPQEARDILNNSLKTEILMTCNLEEWKHFFKLRASEKAHPQMKALALEALDRFREMFNMIF